jgi:hypothetical protein
VVGVSIYEKQARVLGDCVAEALAGNLRLKDIQNPETGAAVVKLLGHAFSAPSLIQVAEHRQPRVALLLLDILADQSPDAATRLAARDLVQKLENARAGQQPIAR